MLIFISEVVDTSKIRKGKFNMIVSSCGTGKTYFCSTTLLERFPDISPYEVIFVTSRSITVDQQVGFFDTTEKFNQRDYSVIDSWNGERDIYDIANKGIQVMTYDKLIHIILTSHSYGLTDLQNVKMIIFDECHSLFTDTFVSNMEVLKYWIHINLPKKDKIFLGLTATPEIIYFYANRWGVQINDLCDPVFKYNVEQLWCTNVKSIPTLLETQVDGKTLIMCNSTNTCFRLQAQIPNSQVLVSKRNDSYIAYEMDKLRNHIVTRGTLPDDTDVLITTSTLREGFSFFKESNIKNVITFISDSAHIIQFVGRCRFNIDNLIVVDSNIKKCGIDFIDNQRDSFKCFLANEEDTEWFDSISKIINHPVENTIRFFSEGGWELKGFKIPSRKERPYLEKYVSESSINQFRKYIYDNWVYNENDDIEDYYIFKEEHKEQIVNKVKELNLIGDDTKTITFHKVINIIKDLGFDVGNGRKLFDGVQYRYRLIKSKNKKEQE